MDPDAAFQEQIKVWRRAMGALRQFLAAAALGIIAMLLWVAILAMHLLSHPWLVVTGWSAFALIVVPLLPMIYFAGQLRRYNQLRQITGRIVTAEQAEGQSWKIEDIIVELARSRWWRLLVAAIFTLIIGYKLWRGAGH